MEFSISAMVVLVILPFGDIFLSIARITLATRLYNYYGANRTEGHKEHEIVYFGVHDDMRHAFKVQHINRLIGSLSKVFTSTGKKQQLTQITNEQKKNDVKFPVLRFYDSIEQ